MRVTLNRVALAIAALFLVFLLLSSTMFVVDQREFALVFSFGEIKQVIAAPGLYFKLPSPMQSVVPIDRRIQTIDTDEADRYPTAEKKTVMVDLVIKWRVVDPKRFYLTFKGDRSSAATRLTQSVRSALTEIFAQRTIHQVIADQHDAQMLDLLKKVSTQAQAEYGVDVVDVRLKRVDLLPEATDDVYRTMQAERTVVANQRRSTGSAEGEQIKADADRQRKIIIADANEKAQGMMGDGDAHASQIYAEAFGRDPAFYAFYQSLETYRASFKDRRDVLVLDANSEFFRYLKNPEGPAGAPLPKR
jgi:membrane protease subunit HflC